MKNGCEYGHACVYALITLRIVCTVQLTVIIIYRFFSYTMESETMQWINAERILSLQSGQKYIPVTVTTCLSL